MKKTVGLTLTIIFIVSLAGSAWTLADMPGAEGFAPSDFHVPEAISVSQTASEPGYMNTLQTSPEMSIQFSVGAMFEEYGGALKVTATNRGTHNIFLTAYRFEWIDSGDTFEKYVYMDIGRGQTLDVGIIGIDGPLGAGNQRYRMSVQLLQNRSGNYYKYMSGNDVWIPFEISYIDVAPLGFNTKYDYKINSDIYFNRANSLVTLDSAQVANAVVQSSIYRIYPNNPDYNYDKLCAIFDHVGSTLTYKAEPEGEDVWQEPEVCLSTATGDCEDYSLLIATMVYQVGGTPRMFLIDGHAFAGIYIGNTSQDVANAESSIMAYYGTDLKIHTIKDEFGYWLIADPLGSFYLGGLSVSASPVDKTDGVWQWSFDDTPVLHAIDITGEVYNPPFWTRPVFWMTIMIVSGIIMIMMILGGQVSDKKAHIVELCMVCGLPIEVPESRCQYCGLQLHNVCAVPVVNCPRCGNLYRPIPPPGY